VYIKLPFEAPPLEFITCGIGQPALTQPSIAFCFNNSSVIPADSSTPTFAIASKAGTLNFDSILSG
jgi:hypothetical protein